MNNSVFFWQLYISIYTLLAGIPLLFFPDTILPMLGFQPGAGPWSNLCGMFLLVLSYLTFNIYRRQIGQMVVHTIVVRSFIVIVLIALGLLGYPPFLYALAGIVLVGVIGSVSTYRKKAA